MIYANDGFSLLTGCEPSELGWSVQSKIPKYPKWVLNCIGTYTFTLYLLVSINPKKTSIKIHKNKN